MPLMRPADPQAPRGSDNGRLASDVSLPGNCADDCLVARGSAGGAQDIEKIAVDTGVLTADEVREVEAGGRGAADGRI